MLIMSGAIPLLPLYAFMGWTAKNLLGHKESQSINSAFPELRTFQSHFSLLCEADTGLSSVSLWSHLQLDGDSISYDDVT
jgi:hypothetical protein